MNIKKIFLTMVLCMLPFQFTLAKSAPVDNWKILATTSSGIYSYDDTSLKSIPANVPPKDIIIMAADASSVITDKNFLGLLGDTYGKKIKKNDQPNKVYLHVEMNLTDHTYRITEASVWTEANKQIEKKKLKTKFAPILANTFVAALFDKAQEKVKAWQEPMKTDDKVATDRR